MSYRFPLRALSCVALLLSGALTACSGGAPSASQNLTPQAATGSQLPANAVAPATAASTLSVSAADRVPPAHIATAHIFLSPKAKTTGTTLAPQSIVYPADLEYFGGPVLKTTRVYNAFVDSNASQFAYPNVFEEHLSYSKMIHIADQYVGTTGSNRYDWAGDSNVSYPAYTTLGDNDLISILHTVAKALGPNAGRAHVYNIFLPKGLNYCGTGTILPVGDCNAASTSPSPYFCAFHSALVFNDVGEVLYTVQPYQDVTYCAVNYRSPSTTTPNGVQDDSEYSVLSHELFETITDPEPGSGWYTANAPAVSGEIGDLCAYLSEQVTLSGKAYYVQREYSNAVHGCDDLQ